MTSHYYVTFALENGDQLQLRIKMHDKKIKKYVLGLPEKLTNNYREVNTKTVSLN